MVARKMKQAVGAGKHRAEFVGEEETETSFGTAVKLTWKIIEGLFEGQFVNVMCSPIFSSQSKLGKFAEMFIGAPVPDGSEFDFADHVGALGVVDVTLNDKGYANVMSFTRDEDDIPF